MIAGIDSDQFGVAGDARITGGAVEPLDQGARGDLPGQRMFAAAGADKKDVHCLKSDAARGGGGVSSQGGDATDASDRRRGSAAGANPAGSRSMSRLARTFIAGLLVILPIVLTVVLVVWVANIVITFVGPNSLVGSVLITLGFSFSASTWVAYLAGVLIVAFFIYVLGVVVESRLQHSVTNL